MDSINLGAAPSEENPTQIGVEHYSELARVECYALIDQLRRQFGNEPDGARLKITANPHEYGIYYSVEIQYDPHKPDAVEYALQLEGEYPTHWDAIAKKMLKDKDTV